MVSKKQEREIRHVRNDLSQFETKIVSSIGGPVEITLTKDTWYVLHSITECENIPLNLLVSHIYQISKKAAPIDRSLEAYARVYTWLTDTIHANHVFNLLQDCRSGKITEDEFRVALKNNPKMIKRQSI